MLNFIYLQFLVEHITDSYISGEQDKGKINFKAEPSSMNG